MKLEKTNCPACARTLPIAAHYSGHNKICDDCATMDRNALVQLVIDTCKREHKAEHSVIAQRKNAKLAEYLLKGKRCTHCHNHKQPAEFDKLSRASDGLQPGCRACNKLRVTMLTAYGPQGLGKQYWHTARDAMRAQAAEQRRNELLTAPNT